MLSFCIVIGFPTSCLFFSARNIQSSDRCASSRNLQAAFCSMSISQRKPSGSTDFYGLQQSLECREIGCRIKVEMILARPGHMLSFELQLHVSSHQHACPSVRHAEWINLVPEILGERRRQPYRIKSTASCSGKIVPSEIYNKTTSML